MEAFSQACRQVYVALFDIGDGEEKLRLESRAKELGINEKVFLLGRLEYNLIPTYMYYSDILILPSIEEGVGRVLLEAMSMNLPIVASNVGGIPLVIDNNKDGLLFEVAGDNAESSNQVVQATFHSSRLFGRFQFSILHGLQSDPQIRAREGIR